MIPEFKRPELEDKELIDYYFAQAPSRSCERTFANVYLWSRQYKVKYALLHDALVFRDEGDGHTYAYPVGKPEAVKAALEELMKICEDEDCEFGLYCVTPENFSQMEEWYPGQFRIEYDRDQADYMRRRSLQHLQERNFTESETILISLSSFIQTGLTNHSVMRM